MRHKGSYRKKDRSINSSSAKSTTRLGPLIGAPLLYVFGQVGDPEPPANGQLGYLALFLYGSLSIFASAAVLLRYVKGAK